VARLASSVARPSNHEKSRPRTGTGSLPLPSLSQILAALMTPVVEREGLSGRPFGGPGQGAEKKQTESQAALISPPSTSARGISIWSTQTAWSAPKLLPPVTFWPLTQKFTSPLRHCSSVPSSKHRTLFLKSL
jgi:hypothetical protein